MFGKKKSGEMEEETEAPLTHANQGGRHRNLQAAKDAHSHHHAVSMNPKSQSEPLPRHKHADEADEEPEEAEEE